MDRVNNEIERKGYYATKKGTTIKELGRPGAEPAKLEQARELLKEGWGIRKIGRELGLGTGTVANLKNEMSAVGAYTSMRAIFRLIPMIILSLAVAIAAFMQSKCFAWPSSALALHARMFRPALIWVIIFLIGLFVHGKRGPWLLVGAPLALFWPAAIGWLYLVCNLTYDCL